MTAKERYCTGRAEYLAEHSGYSITEGYKIAEQEWKQTSNDWRVNK